MKTPEELDELDMRELNVAGGKQAVLDRISKAKPYEPESTALESAASGSQTLPEFTTDSELAGEAGEKRKVKTIYRPITIAGLTFSLENHYLIKGWLGRVGVSTAYGPPGSMKSLVALTMGAAIAGGVRWQGRLVLQGTVVFVILEGEQGFKNRIEAMVREGKIERNAPILLISQNYNILDVPQTIDLCTGIEEEVIKLGLSPVRCVFIDTLACSMSGEEETNSAMPLAGEGAKSICNILDCHTMLIHHPGKDLSKGARGGSSLKGLVDTELTCAAVDKQGCSVTQTKQKDLPQLHSPVYFALESITLGIDADGDDITAPMAEEVDELGSDADQAAEIKVKQTIEAMLELLPRDSLSRWFDACVHIGAFKGNDDPAKKASNFYTRKMKDNGYIDLRTGGNNSKKVTRKTPRTNEYDDGLL